MIFETGVTAPRPLTVTAKLAGATQAHLGHLEGLHVGCLERAVAAQLQTFALAQRCVVSRAWKGKNLWTCSAQLRGIQVPLAKLVKLGATTSRTDRPSRDRRIAMEYEVIREVSYQAGALGLLNTDDDPAALTLRWNLRSEALLWPIPEQITDSEDVRAFTRAAECAERQDLRWQPRVTW